MCNVESWGPVAAASKPLHKPPVGAKDSICPGTAAANCNCNCNAVVERLRGKLS